MSDTKATAATKVPEKEFEYVTIPDRDLFDNSMHSFWMNNTEYKPGTHFVEKHIAESLRERIALFQKGQIRVMQPQIDRKAVNDANGHRGSGTGEVVSGDALNRVFV